MFLKHARPSRVIPACMLMWGITQTLMGLCTNFGGLVAARFCLGIAESPLFPGICYYLVSWYKRDECAFLSMLLRLRTELTRLRPVTVVPLPLFLQQTSVWPSSSPRQPWLALSAASSLGLSRTWEVSAARVAGRGSSL